MEATADSDGSVDVGFTADVGGSVDGHPLETLINNLHLPLLPTDETHRRPAITVSFGTSMFARPGTSWSRPPRTANGFSPLYQKYSKHILTTAYAEFG